MCYGIGCEQALKVLYVSDSSIDKIKLHTVSSVVRLYLVAYLRTGYPIMGEYFGPWSTIDVTWWFLIDAINFRTIRKKSVVRFLNASKDVNFRNFTAANRHIIQFTLKTNFSWRNCSTRQKLWGQYRVSFLYRYRFHVRQIVVMLSIRGYAIEKHLISKIKCFSRCNWILTS